MSSRLAVPILALVAVPVIAAAALLAAFAHEFVSEDVAPSMGRVIEGSVWIVTGLIAWWRVPGNRIGPLATAFGFVDIAGQLYWNAALPFSLAPMIDSFMFAIGVHLFLAFPSGRLQTRSRPRGRRLCLRRDGDPCAGGGDVPRDPAGLPGLSHEPALCRGHPRAGGRHRRRRPRVLVVGVLVVTIALVIRHWRGREPGVSPGARPGPGACRASRRCRSSRRSSPKAWASTGPWRR